MSSMEAANRHYPEAPGPEDEVQSVEASAWLAEEIAELPEREQIVLLCITTTR